MSVELIYPHLVRQPGQPARLERHPRTRVAMIAADYLWRGWSADEMVRQYPYLTPAEIHAALTYYFDHRQEIEDELVTEYHEAEAWRKTRPPDPLLVRLKEQRGR